MITRVNHFDTEPAPPSVLRTILLHMRRHGWSTRDELRRAAAVSQQAIRIILAADLQLRRRQRKTQGSGRGPDEFNLPVKDTRGRWIYTGTER